MKYTDISKLYQTPSVRAKSIKQPFTDTDIIDLQYTCSTIGLHTITVPNEFEGRAIITTILQSLNCYTHATCLSMSKNELSTRYVDLYYELTLGGFLYGNVENKLDDFFVSHFDSDFLWIEAAPLLQEQPWFYMFERKLSQFNVDRHIPVVMVMS